MKSLDEYIMQPSGKRDYLANYGWHFNKKAFDFASKMMKRKNPTTGKMERIEPMSKEQVEEMLTRFNIMLENDNGYDAVYVANMAKADFYKSSITDEQHLAMFVKDMIDDADQAEGFVFRRWYSDMIGAGKGIDWEDLI